MIRLYLLLIAITCSIFCQRHDRDIYMLANEWKRDSKGCDGLRFSIASNKYNVLNKKLIGWEKDWIIRNFGIANDVFDEGNFQIFSYFAEPGIQCQDSVDNIDVLRVEFVFKNNKVIDIRKILP